MEIAVAASGTGVYVGVQTEDGALVRHGTSEWQVPFPPKQPGIGWSECGGLALAVDSLDPSRIAVNVIEYQGGSHGLYGGRFGGDMTYVPSPTDSDIRFGQPMVLRGNELFAHDMATLFHMRLGGATTELDLSDLADELGWHAAIDASGETLVVEAFSTLIFLQRAGTGPFRRGRVVKTPAPIDALAVFDGRAIVAAGEDLWLHGADGQDLKIGRAAGPVVALASRYAVSSVDGGLAVLEIMTGAKRRIEHAQPVAACALVGDRVAVVSPTGDVATY